MQVTTRKCSTGEPEPYCIKGTAARHRRQQQPSLRGLSMELRRRTMADFCWFLVSIYMFWISCLENISWNPCKLQLKDVVQGSPSLAAFLKVLLRRRRQQPGLLGLSTSGGGMEPQWNFWIKFFSNSQILSWNWTCYASYNSKMWYRGARALLHWRYWGAIGTHWLF